MKAIPQVGDRVEIIGGPRDGAQARVRAVRNRGQLFQLALGHNQAIVAVNLTGFTVNASALGLGQFAVGSVVRLGKITDDGPD